MVMVAMVLPSFRSSAFLLGRVVCVRCEAFTQCQREATIARLSGLPLMEVRSDSARVEVPYASCVNSARAPSAADRL